MWRCYVKLWTFKIQTILRNFKQGEWYDTRQIKKDLSLFLKNCKKQMTTYK